jgi:hypothetical protein
LIFKILPRFLNSSKPFVTVLFRFSQIFVSGLLFINHSVLKVFKASNNLCFALQEIHCLDNSFSNNSLSFFSSNQDQIDLRAKLIASIQD